MNLLAWLRSLFAATVTPSRPEPPSPPAPPVIVPEPSAIPTVNVLRCIKAMNAERTNQGLPTLEINGRLCSAAQIQANHCAAIDTLTHAGPKGSTVGDRLAVVGYTYSRAAENAAQQPLPARGWPGGDVRTPEWAVDGWMQSPGHRANLLGPYTQTGAAYADAASGTRYWVAVLARPLT